jgi:hypothetical protein
MSRMPDRGYQPVAGGLPPRGTSGQGLFDRRSDRPPPLPDRNDYERTDRRGLERKPVSPPGQQSSGFLSRLSGHHSPQQQGGVFSVVKVI